MRWRLADTLSLFDPLAFAPRIGARALFTCGQEELEHVEPVVEAMRGEAQIELRTGRGFIDHGVEEAVAGADAGADAPGLRPHSRLEDR